MCRITAPAAVLCCLLTLTGCGRDEVGPTTAPTTPPTAAPTTAPTATPTTIPTTAPATATAGGPTAAAATPLADPTDTDAVAAYRYLVHDVTGFVAAAIAAEQQTLGEEPETPEQVLAAVDYDLADGVTLAAWEKSGICFTGPGGTYWAFGEARRVYLRLTLGTGECDDPAPDLVLDVGPGRSLRHLTTRVRAGEGLAARLPELDDFVDLLNDELR